MDSATQPCCSSFSGIRVKLSSVEGGGVTEPGFQCKTDQGRYEHPLRYRQDYFAP
jgi:hypothetical protein